MRVLGQHMQKQINGKCQGFNTTYYSPDGENSVCDKFKLNYFFRV